MTLTKMKSVGTKKIKNIFAACQQGAIDRNSVTNVFTVAKISLVSLQQVIATSRLRCLEQ